MLPVSLTKNCPKNAPLPSLPTPEKLPLTYPWPCLRISICPIPCTVFWTKNDDKSYEMASERLAATLDWVIMIERVARSPIPCRHFIDVSAIHAVTSELVLEGPIRVAKVLEDRSPNPYPEMVIEIEPVEG
jgi:hypothetical protein